MQKGTVCGADRSVYNLYFLGFLFNNFFCFVFLFQCVSFVKGLAGLSEIFRFLTKPAVCPA